MQSYNRCTAHNYVDCTQQPRCGCCTTRRTNMDVSTLMPLYLFVCLWIFLVSIRFFACGFFFVLVCFPYINQSVLKLNIVICYWRMIDDLWYWKLQPILLWYSNKRKQCHNIDNVILLTGRCTLMCVCTLHTTSFCQIQQLWWRDNIPTT